MLTGSCLCNAIRYEIDGELGPIVKCHCSKCRKANGTAFATNAAFSKAAFRFVTGEDSVGEFESSPGVFRVFCRNCGSPLYSRRPAMPDMLRLRIGTLDTPLQAKPTAHIYAGSKAEWDDICDDLPQYQELPV